MELFLTALGLFLVIEGLVYGAFPSIGHKLGEYLRTASSNELRLAGLGAAAFGLFIIWLVNG